MKFLKKVLDICCFLLVSSLLTIILGLLFLSLASERASIPENIELVVGIVIQLSVLSFSISAIALWLYAMRYIWLTRKERSLLKNSVYLSVVISFSWVAGFIVYRKTRHKLHAP
jgi:hypothetical protein